MTHIAMDVHKKRSVLAYQTPAESEPQIVRCYTTPGDIAKVLSERPRPWIVCLEATRQSPAVVRGLQELGVDEIQLVDPKGLKAFLKGKPKSDARDAKDAGAAADGSVGEGLPGAHGGPGDPGADAHPGVCAAREYELAQSAAGAVEPARAGGPRARYICVGSPVGDSWRSRPRPWVPTDRLPLRS